MATAVHTPTPAKKRAANAELLSEAIKIVAQARNAYAGASQFSETMALWNPSLRSADAEVLRDHARVRARARDLARNNPYGRQTVRMSRLGVIGKKFKYSCRPDWRFLGIDAEEAIRWGQEFERVWESYAHGPDFHIDAGRRMTFTQHMGLLHDCEVVDGEALISYEWDADRRWKGCWQAVDVDRLSSPHGKPDGLYLKAGVALDRLSAPIAYHIRDGHPGDHMLQGQRHNSWSTIPRYSAWGRPNICHVYEMTRAGQTRGISVFAPVIVAMKMGAEYTELALQAAALHASISAVITSPSNYKDVLESLDAMDADDTSANAITEYALDHLKQMANYYGPQGLNFMVAGSKVPVLPPGDDLDIKSTGTTAANYGEFQQHSTKTFAAGTGTDPIAVSQDFSNVNYSSARMAGAMNHRSYEERRERLGNNGGLPMVGACLDEAIFSGAMDLPKGVKPHEYFEARAALINGQFISQGPPMLDPVKERQGQKLGLEIGAETLQDIAAAEGKDYRDILAQQQREKIEREQMGLPMPSAGVLPNSLPGEGADATAD